MWQTDKEAASLFIEVLNVLTIVFSLDLYSKYLAMCIWIYYSLIHVRKGKTEILIQERKKIIPMRIKRKLRRGEKALMDKYNNNFMAHSKVFIPTSLF